MVIFIVWDAAICHVSPLLEKIIWIIAPPSLRKSARHHMMQSKAKIEARLARGEGERKDFCSYIFELRDEMMLNDWHMAAYSSALIIAGSETTATTLGFLTYWLCKRRISLFSILNSAFHRQEPSFTSRLAPDSFAFREASC